MSELVPNSAVPRNYSTWNPLHTDVFAKFIFCGGQNSNGHVSESQSCHYEKYWKSNDMKAVHIKLEMTTRNSIFTKYLNHRQFPILQWKHIFIHTNLLKWFKSIVSLIFIEFPLRIVSWISSYISDWSDPL